LTRFIAVTVTSALALSTAGYVAADTGTAAPGARASFQQRLGLTDDQMAAIREIHARHADQRKQIWQSLRRAQSEARQLALNSGDPAAVKAKTAEVAALLAQSVELRTTILQEMSPILTPEQRQQLATMSPRGHGHHRGPRAPQSS
jgi:Spy/CpxP family protein refolding chaperone